MSLSAATQRATDAPAEHPERGDGTGPGTSLLADEGRAPTAAVLRVDPGAWDAFVAAAPNGSFPQLGAWARASAAKGWRSTRVVVDAPGGPVGAQVLVHRMRPGPWSRGYAPRGPVGASIDAEAIERFTAALREVARAMRLTHVVVDPELEHGHPVEGWFSASGWTPIPAIQIDRTRLVDLAQPEDALWSGLRSSARWSVNKARRAGHTVEDAGEAGLDLFERIYLETARRVGFQASASFREVYREFARTGDARLLLCRAPDGEAVATLVLLPCGDRVIELYGASTSGGARGRANYLIKWEAMRSSRERGYRRYDMWGTDVEGLAEFKAGFGGEERRYMGAWELVTDARARRAVDVVQRARAGVRRPGRRATEGSAGPRSTAAPEGTAGLTVTSVLREAPADWDARAVDAAGGHVMQGTAWAAHRRAQGGDPRFVLFEDGGVALVVLRRSPLVPGAAATVRRGPAHRGEGGERLAERCAALAAWARAEGARHLFVDPELDHDPAYEAAMDRLGFAVTDEVQPSIHVMRLDLPAGATEESVLAGVSKSTRQRIRAAERAGVTVRADIAMERLDAFGGLLVDRAEDLGIAMRPELGYLAAWRRLIAAGHARLLVAEHEDRLLGGLLMFHQGGIHSTAYSADRADLRREFPGAMHLVRWTAIRDALSAGMHAIELGGVDLPGRREPPAKGDPNHGLFEHKASFGARWIVRTPARRRVLRPWAERYVDARGAALRAIRSLTRR